MSDDVMDAATKHEGKRKPKLVDVRVVERVGQSAMVEWFNKDGKMQRGHVPADMVVDGKCAEDELQAATPYGVPWERFVSFEGMTAEYLAERLRARGIWTRKEMEAQPNGVMAAISDVTAIIFRSLRSGVKNYEKGE